MEERFVDVDGLRVRCLEEGTGRPVLLLHGASLGSSADVWSRNLAGLAARGLRAIAPDQPGFGMSDDPPDHSVGFRMRFVPRLLEALGLDSAFVIGHSQSGRIAVTLAFEHPRCFSRVVVVGTASLLPPLPDAPRGESGEGDEGGAREPTIAETRALLESQVFHRTSITDEAVELRQRMSLGKNFEAAAARREGKKGERQKEARPLWQRLVEVPVPTRLIYGRQDRSAEARAAIARRLNPSLDLHLVDRCGHLVMWDAPEAFAALAGDFLCL